MTHSQPDMTETLLIESASTDVEGKHEDYSEWRMFHAGLGSTFQIVVVTEGYHNRDFQTTQGAVSVIDPEVLGKLRKEASAISNNMMRSLLAVYFVTLLDRDALWLVCDGC